MKIRASFFSSRHASSPELYIKTIQRAPLLTKEGWPRFADGVVLGWGKR